MQHIGDFYILKWAAWAPGIDTNDKWRDWAKYPKLILGDEKIQTKLIPAGIKRRCSEVSKMALHVSTVAADTQPINYAVFGAQHGELQRCVDLFDSIAKRECLSPMAFAQSVHNTASGLYSIIHKKTHSMNAIAAGDQTFNMSIVDALVWLKLNPGQNAMVTVYDDSFPKAYEHLEIGVNCRYAFSLIISLHKPGVADTQLISCHLDDNKSERSDTQLNKDLPQALNFLAWYLNTEKGSLTLANPQQFKYTKT